MTLFGYPPADWLPVVFAGLMGLSILIYVVLDGYDLGVGGLSLFATEAERDRMAASIGPFWDANETWLILAIGLLLVAFPAAHGAILTAFYIPVLIMLIGLVLRGVAFEFRAKDLPERKALWDKAFWAGSSLACLSQGYMLGLYVLGLRDDLAAHAFAALTAICLAAAYGFIGAGWLILKTDGDLKRKAVAWAGRLAALGALGLVAISIATPLASPRLYARWLDWPATLYLAPLPLLTVVAFGALVVSLRGLARGRGPDWPPFALATTICTLGFGGMAYSFYPYVVPDRMTVWAAAAAPQSLGVILVGALFVMPIIIAYSAFSYYVFRGKATTLRYD